MSIPQSILSKFPLDKYVIHAHWHKQHGDVYYVRRYGSDYSIYDKERGTFDLGIWYDKDGKVLYREPLFLHDQEKTLEWFRNIIP